MKQYLFNTVACPRHPFKHFSLDTPMCDLAPILRTSQLEAVDSYILVGKIMLVKGLLAT